MMKRVESVQKEQEFQARHEALEQELQRGSAGGRPSTSPRGPKPPRQLEYPACPGHVTYRGNQDTRQVADFMMDWEQLALYVKEEYKVSHFLTCLTEAVRSNLTTALRSRTYNNGQGYSTATQARLPEIIEYLKKTYDKPDHLYKSLVKWRDLRQQHGQSLEDFLRTRDQ